MKLLLTGSSYPSTEDDWKGLFVRRLLEALARRDDLELAAWLPPGPMPARVASVNTGDDDAWLARLMDNGGIAHLLRSHPLRGIAAAASLTRRLHRAYRRSDAGLFHINWLQNALALPADGRPALVAALGSDLQLLRLPGMRALLRRAFRQRRVAICPNAEWMLPMLEAAFGDIATVRFVPFGIDPCWYALKRQFEDATPPKWLCVSRITADKIGPLFEWTAPYFAGGRSELHLFGPMQEQRKLPEWVRWHGPTTPDTLCERWFPQAHGLLTLSRHAEGRPQVMLEAMASGLPIIASRLPAHDDLLVDGGGLLCNDAASVLAALETFANPARNRATGLHGQARMRADIGTWDDCVARYQALYCQLAGSAQA